MRHRLSTYILKNPPKKKNKKSKGGHAEAPSPSTDVNGAVGAGENGVVVAEVGSDDEMTKRIKAEASELNSDSQLVDEGWSADTSANAIKARMGAITAGIAGLALGGGEDESDEDADSPYTQLGNWAKENPGASAVEVFKKVQELGIEKKHKAVQVLAQTLFTGDIVTEIPAYVPVFQKVRCYISFHIDRAKPDDCRW
jgi:translation initiation factor 5